MLSLNWPHSVFWFSGCIQIHRGTDRLRLFLKPADRWVAEHCEVCQEVPWGSLDKGCLVFTEKLHARLQLSYMTTMTLNHPITVPTQSVSLWFYRTCKERYTIKDRTPLNIYGAGDLKLRKWNKQSHNLQTDQNISFAKLQEVINAKAGQAQSTVKNDNQFLAPWIFLRDWALKCIFIEFLDCNECVYRILCKAWEFSCFKMIFLYSSDFIYIFNRTVKPF